MKYKKFTISFKVPVYEMKRNDNSISFPMTYDVEGMMRFYKRAMTTKVQQDLMDEYVKMWLFKKVGLKTYPIMKEVEQKAPSPENA